MLSPETTGLEVGAVSLAAPFYPAQNSPAATSCSIFLFVPESSEKREIGSAEMPKKGKKILVKKVKFLERQDKIML